jgi:hypothetical protein
VEIRAAQVFIKKDSVKGAIGAKFFAERYVKVQKPRIFLRARLGQRRRFLFIKPHGGSELFPALVTDKMMDQNISSLICPAMKAFPKPKYPTFIMKKKEVQGIAKKLLQ